MALEWQDPVGHGLSDDRPAAEGRQKSTVLSRHRTTQADGANPARRENDQAEAQRPELQPLLALWPYLARHKLQLVLAGVALVVSAVATLVIPMAVRRVIDLGFGTHDGAFIDRYFAMLVVIGLVLAIASAARFYYVNWLGERVVADLRSDVFRHVADLGPAFFERTHSGELMSRLTADTTQIKAIAGSSLSQALRSFIMLLGALVMMFVTSVHLSLLVLLAIPLTILPLIAFGRSVRRLSRRAQDTLAEASAYAAENLAASRTMQAFAHEKAASERYRRDVEFAFDAAKARMRARAVLTALAMFLVIGSITGVLWFAAAAVIDGQHDGRPAQPVRALRRVCRRRFCADLRNLGRSQPGRRRRRAAHRAAGRRAGNPLALLSPSRFPFRRAERSRSTTFASPTPDAPICRRSTAYRSACRPATP